MGRGRAVMRAAAAAAGVVLGGPALAMVAGGFLPAAPWIGRLGTLDGLALPLVVAAAIGGSACCLGAVVLGRGERSGPYLGLAAIAIATLLGAIVQLGTVLSFAGSVGAPVDLGRWLSAAASLPGDPGTGSPDRIVTVGTVDGTDLRAGIWEARAAGDGGGRSGSGAGGGSPGAAIVYVHGGGFTAGGLGSRPAFFRAMADAGIAVVDVEYRLAPPARWDQAAPDVLCNLAWLTAHGDEMGVDPARLVLMGESAGGNLALVAAWVQSTGDFTSSCGGDPAVPIGVVAVAPAADLAGIWSDGTISNDGIPFPEAFVGGPPDQYPDRYLAASPAGRIRAGLPPILLITGAIDRLVRPERTRVLAAAVGRAGGSCSLLVVPLADHGFDGAADGHGSQIEETILPRFVHSLTGGPAWSGPTCPVS
jgi:acetyl esterase/lipase